MSPPALEAQSEVESEAQNATDPPTINTLICHRDMGRALPCLGSFLLACQGQIAFRFFSDGSITPDDAATLCAVFPASQLIQRRELAEAVQAHLTPYPRCREMSSDSPFGLKLVEMPLFCRHHLGLTRFIYIDSDILFFQVMPNWRELWNRNFFLCEGNVPLSGRASLLLRRYPLIASVNAGMLSLDLRWHDLDLIEEFLGQDQLRSGYHVLSEQTCWAILGARAHKNGAEIRQISPEEIVCKHFLQFPNPQTLAIHLISRLKQRLPELAARALNAQNKDTAAKREISFCRTKNLSLAQAAWSSFLFRSGLRAWLLRRQETQQQKLQQKLR